MASSKKVIHYGLRPAFWCKSSGEMRFCVDYRKLNSVTKPISFPLPILTDMLETIGDAKPAWFSLLDLRSGFHQIPIHPNSRHKTSFITHEGQWQYRFLSFGLSNSPAAFQQLMSNIFQRRQLQVHVSIHRRHTHFQ